MSIMSLLLGAGGSYYGPTPTIDGTATGLSSTSTTVATNSTTLTTAKTNNIIVAIVCIEGTPVIAGTITGISGGGLSWTKYTSNFFSSTVAAGYGVLQEVWYATASSTLSAVTITASCSVTYDDATIVAFGVNGCNLSAPFDTGSGMPINTNFPSSSTTRTVSGINTNSNNPLMIASWFSDVSDALNTGDIGFSQLAYVTNNGAVKWMYNFVEYKGVSGAAQSSATITGVSGVRNDVIGATVFAMTG
jgi:hypothetical protein